MINSDGGATISEGEGALRTKVITASCSAYTTKESCDKEIGCSWLVGACVGMKPVGLTTVSSKNQNNGLRQQSSLSGQVKIGEPDKGDGFYEYENWLIGLASGAPDVTSCVQSLIMQDDFDYKDAEEFCKQYMNK